MTIFQSAAKYIEMEERLDNARRQRDRWDVMVDVLFAARAALVADLLSSVGPNIQEKAIYVGDKVVIITHPSSVEVVPLETAR